jgi:hypothetical protein
MKDWNEAHEKGVDIRAMADKVSAYTNEKVVPLRPQQQERFTLTCLEDVKAKPIDWVRENHLARGHLTLIGGDPDKGKSQITIDTAARISKGAHWPNGPRAPIGSTIFLCSEDGLADTIKPRAEAAGANVSQLYALNSTILKNGKLTRFTLKDDLDMLGEAAEKVNATLIVIDAITSYMGKVENNSTTDIRSVLDPLSQWAEKTGIAICGVTHPPKAAQKNAIRQFTGSLAYVASARLAFFSMDDPDDQGRILFLAVKNNIGPKAAGRGYRIATKEVSYGIVAPYVQWDDTPVDYTADQVLAASSASRDGVKKAISYLEELLANGDVTAQEGLEGAEANGIATRTLDRARKIVGVVAKKEEGVFNGAWFWTKNAKKTANL